MILTEHTLIDNVLLFNEEMMSMIFFIIMGMISYKIKHLHEVLSFMEILILF